MAPDDAVVIEGAEPQIIGDGLLMLGDRRLPFAARA
jgi:hypothetical protein